MTCVLLPRGAFAHGDTGRHTGRRRVMGMFLQSRDTTGFGGHHQRGEAWDGPPPEAAAGAGPADTLIPDRGLQPGRERARSFIRAAALTPRAGGVLGRCPRLAGRADQPQQTPAQVLGSLPRARPRAPAGPHTRPHRPCCVLPLPWLRCPPLSTPAGPTLPAWAVLCGHLQLQPTAQPVPDSSTCFRLALGCGGVGVCYRQLPLPKGPGDPALALPNPPILERICVPDK